MNISDLKGSIVALVTPMHADGSVDWDALEALVEWHISEGTHGIVAVGTTGESATLTTDEHLRVIDFCIKQVAGRVPVLAGTGSNSTMEAIEMTREAKILGADAALIVVPYYNKPTQKGLLAHYTAIADAVDIQQVLYNVPGRTALSLSNEIAEQLSHHDNIVAIKDATGDLALGADLIKRVGSRMTVLSGDDPSALELMKLGARGNISVTANVVPRAMSQVFGLAHDGKFDEAQQIHEQIKHLHQDLFCEPNPIVVKYALNRMQKIGNGIRLPMTWIEPEHEPAIDAALKQAKVIN